MKGDIGKIRGSFTPGFTLLCMGVVGLLALVGCSSVIQGQNTPGLVLRVSVPSFIKSVAWSPDGTRIAAGASVPPLKVFRATDGQVLLQLSDISTNRVAWSLDSQYLAVASIAPSDTLHVWQITQSQSRSVLTANPPGKADSVAWSHDGTRLALGVGGLSNTSGGVSNSAVVIYDTKSWQMLATLPYTYYVMSVTWSPDDKHIAFASSTVTFSDNSLVVWDIDKSEQPQALRYFPNKRNTINSVAWSPTSDRLVAISSNDGTAGVWDIAAGKKVTTLVQGDNVMDVAWSPDGKRLASASQNGTAEVWDASSGALLKTFTCIQLVNAVAWSPDGKLLAVGCDDMTVSIWDTK